MTIYPTRCYSKILKRQNIETKDFEDGVNDLIAKRKLKQKDYDDFKKSLVENPEQRNIITGTGGIRKTDLKSASKGKSGGFRVCFLNVEDKTIIFLLFIYTKNDQANLIPSEKLELKQIAEAIKKRLKK